MPITAISDVQADKPIRPTREYLAALDAAVAVIDALLTGTLTKSDLVLFRNSFALAPSITLRRDDSDSAMDTGDDCGTLNFEGSTSGSGTYEGAIQVLGEANEAWNASQQGARLIVKVIGDGDDQLLEVLRLLGAANAAESIEMQSAASGVGPTIQPRGAAADIDLNVKAKGTTSGELVLGEAGDTRIGDGTERTMRPHTDKKVNLGSSSFKFNKGWVDKLDVESSANLPYSEDNVSNPPTAAQCDLAFPDAEQGFVGTINDNGGGANVYAVRYDGANWWHGGALTQCS